MKFRDVVILLLEKKAKKVSKNKVKLYTPELMIRKKKNGAEYEVSEIDMSDEDNPMVTIFRYDVNGSRTSESVHSFDEIETKFDIA